LGKVQLTAELEESRKFDYSHSRNQSLNHGSMLVLSL